jgi:hypothetical protein
MEMVRRYRSMGRLCRQQAVFHPEAGAGSAKLSAGKISRIARSTHFIRSAMHRTPAGRRLA